MKRTAYKLAFGCIVAGAILAGSYGILRGYRIVRQRHLLKQASEFASRDEPRMAILCLQHLLSMNPKDADACRLMANLLEHREQNAALLWRSRVVDYLPESISDRLALAQTALGVGDFATATNALNGVSAEARNSGVFQNLAGTIALGLHQFDDAELCYERAIRLAPGDPVPRLNLSVLYLRSTNLQKLVEATATLTAIANTATNGFLRCTAIRELAMGAVRQQKPEEALLLAARLLNETNSTFADRVFRLNLLDMTTNADFKSSLEQYEQEASMDAVKAYELGIWQLSRFGTTNTLAWVRTLPAALQTNQPLALFEAECAEMAGEWKIIQIRLQKQNWAEIEFTRRAFLCRALSKQGFKDSAKVEWELALKDADNKRAGLSILFRLAAQWDMNREGEDILWAFIKYYPKEDWAPAALGRVLYASGRTRELMKLSHQRIRQNPNDLVAKNNLAATALLLNAQDLKPHDLAREVYDVARTNADYAVTYAFSLYLRNENREAIEVIEKLDSKKLEKPSIAGYYGLILKASGQNEKANVYFDCAFKSSLLPEERKLFEKAKAGA